MIYSNQGGASMAMGGVIPQPVKKGLDSILARLTKAQRKAIPDSIEFWGGGKYYRKKSLDVWEQHFKNDPKYQIGNLTFIIHQLLNRKQITASEAERLIQMLNSRDISDKIIAIGGIKTIFKKWRNVQ